MNISALILFICEQFDHTWYLPPLIASYIYVHYMQLFICLFKYKHRGISGLLYLMKCSSCIVNFTWISPPKMNLLQLAKIQQQNNIVTKYRKSTVSDTHPQSMRWQIWMLYVTFISYKHIWYTVYSVWSCLCCLTVHTVRWQW